MCIKRGYKCYKGEEDEECCNASVREALRNRTYFFVLIVGIILMIIALVIKTSSDAVFVNQVSFASTITSIILSVIAIWMSITGERSTNEIKTKVSESVDRLLKTSSDSEELVTVLSDMLSRQNESYNNIKDQMESVLLEVRGVKTTVMSMNDSFIGMKENTTATFPNDVFLFGKNIIDGIPDKKLKKTLCNSLVKVFEIKKNSKSFEANGVYDAIDALGGNRDALYGIIVALKHNGFFKDDKNFEGIKKLMQESCN